MRLARRSAAKARISMEGLPWATTGSTAVQHWAPVCAARMRKLEHGRGVQSSGQAFALHL